MAHLNFIRLSEHTAVIKGESTVVWKILLEDASTVFLQARHAHTKLGGNYWTDSKHIIPRERIQLANTTFEPVGEVPVSDVEPTLYQQIECGQCERISLINITKITEGTHYCNGCRGTIVLAVGTRLNLKNGSKALNTQKGR